MPSDLQILKNRLEKRKREDRPGVISEIDPNSGSSAYAQDLIDLINVLEKRCNALEERINALESA
jgi:hypothetical protein